MPRSELLARPTSGSAWSELRRRGRRVASAAPTCATQDSDASPAHPRRPPSSSLAPGTRHTARRLAPASWPGSPAREVGCGNAVLALGRQLTGYVLAADFAGLSGANDTDVPSLAERHPDEEHRRPLDVVHPQPHPQHSVNNWGAYAGASRIAADLYLGDDADLAAAAKVTRGFLGDRAGLRRVGTQPRSRRPVVDVHRAAGFYTPVNDACTKSGVNVDGGVVADISRGGSLDLAAGQDRHPVPARDSIQGLGIQVELLYRNGYANAWGWSSKALKRMADIVTRSAHAGGTGWNADEQPAGRCRGCSTERYGTSIPTSWSGMGRGIGFTDWLYGNGGGSAAPKPTSKPKPTPKPTTTPRRPAAGPIRSSPRLPSDWPGRPSPRRSACRLS